MNVERNGVFFMTKKQLTKIHGEHDKLGFWRITRAGNPRRYWISRVGSDFGISFKDRVFLPLAKALVADANKGFEVPE